ncbi:hypothetical protein B0H11DRAFT_2216958 [Mycena galericulata]|nr:hypothetical protein B0H11DRAFT_2216958 [Mycena galericulata]
MRSVRTFGRVHSLLGLCPKPPGGFSLFSEGCAPFRRRARPSKRRDLDGNGPSRDGRHFNNY